MLLWIPEPDIVYENGLSYMFSFDNSLPGLNAKAFK